MAPETQEALDDDSSLDGGLNDEGDTAGEFTEAAADAAAAEFAAYEKAGRVDDVDKQRELITEGTTVQLGFVSAELAMGGKVQAGKEYIYGKFQVNKPDMYADGERDFGIYFRLTAKASDPQKPNSTAFNVTQSQLRRIAAAIWGVEVTSPAVVALIEPALKAAAEQGSNPTERRAAFFVALTKLINEELVGKTFTTDIGVRPARVWNGKKYRETQDIGKPHYPGRKEQKSALKPVTA
jgi:hypothetical protein